MREIAETLNKGIRSPVRDGTEKPRRLRPRDAATMIIVDDEGTEPRVLMGRRRADLRFMAGKYVFPGGRIDRADHTAPAADELRTEVQRKLTDRMRGRPSPTRPRALALTAIRETFEETGVLLGVAAGNRAKCPPAWTSFLKEGVVPALQPLTLIGRAITPPGRPRRFDTRFFAVSAGNIAKALPAETAADGELEDIAWVPLSKTRDLDLPRITHVMLDVLETRLAQSVGLTDGGTVPFFYARGQRFHCDYL